MVKIKSSIPLLLLVIAVICAISTGLIYAAGLTISTGEKASLNTSTLTLGSNENLSNAGTLQLGTGKINIGGNWANTGTFQANTGSVAFTGTSTQTISGNNSFYNFTCTSAGNQLNFEADKTQIITSAWTITGSSGNYIKLRSTSSGTQWKVDPQGTRDVSYVYVQDSNNISITSINPTNWTNGGNNTNWGTSGGGTTTTTTTSTTTTTAQSGGGDTTTTSTTTTTNNTTSTTARSTTTTSATSSTTSTTGTTQSTTTTTTGVTTTTTSTTSTTATSTTSSTTTTLPGQPTPTQPPVPAPSPTPENEGVVYGFVTDEEANPLEGVAVTMTGSGYSEDMQTESDGYYEFKGLAAGDYTITYEKSGYKSGTQSVSLGEGDVVNLGTLTLEITIKGEIYGYVLNTKDDPIKSVKIQLKVIKTKTSMNTTSDEDGYFLFDDLDSGVYMVIARKRGYRKFNQRIKLGEGEEKEIEIVLRRTTTGSLLIVE